VATVTTTSRIDDLDGSSADVTVVLTFNAQRYRVDLSKRNYQEHIAPLVKVALQSKVGRPARNPSGPKASRTSRRSSLGANAYSRLGADDQVASRRHLKRVRVRFFGRRGCALSPNPAICDQPMSRSAINESRAELTPGSSVRKVSGASSPACYRGL
jgi:hypothetical protein